jgi:hypothetical protein
MIITNEFLNKIPKQNFGTHQQPPIRTWDDPRFFAMIIDALNLEAYEITGMTY